ncbi:hypothetical protein D3C78_107930 [compost metagenome]
MQAIAQAQPTQFITSMNALKKFNPEEVKKNDIWMVAPHLIEFEPGFNARKRYDSKKQLKHIASLRRQWNTDPSQIPPMRVRIKDGRVYMGDGHCRYIALMQAINEDGLEMKFVYCLPFVGNDVAQLLLLLTSQDGLKLDYVEQADVFSRLISLGLTDEELAEKRGTSAQHVRNIRSIASLPYRLQEYISNEVIPYTNALEVVRMYGETKAMELIDGIVEAKRQDLEALLVQPVATDAPAAPTTVAEGDAQGLVQTEAQTVAQAAEQTDATTETDEPVIKVTRKDLNKAMGRSNVRFNKKLKESTVNVVSQLAEMLVDGDGEQTITLTPELVAELKKLKEGFTAPQPTEPEAGSEDGEGSIVAA